MNDSYSKTISGIFYFLAINVVNNGASFIFLIAVARVLPNIADLGILTILQTIIMTSTVIAGAGLPHTSTRFLSNYIGTGQQEKATNTLRFVLKAGLLTSTFLSIALYAFSSLISEVLLGSTDYTFVIQLVAIDSFLLSIINLGFYSLSAFQFFRKIAIIAIIGTIAKFSFASFFLLAGLGIDGIITGFVIGDVLSVILYAPLLITLAKQHTRVLIDKKELLNYSLPWYGSSLLAFAAEVMDRYLLQIMAGSIAVGLYTPAILFGAILRMLLGSMEQALLPHLSRAFGKSGIDSLASSNKLISRYMFLIYIPIGFLIAAIMPSVIPLIYGEKYSPSIMPSIIIVIGFTLPAIGYVFNTSLMSAGHSKVFLVSTLIGILAQILVGIMLIPITNEVGAAIARSLAFGAMMIYPAIKLKNLGGLSYDRSALMRGVIGALIMTLIITFILQATSSPIMVIPSIPVGILFYLLFLRFTNGITVEDIKFLNSITNNKIQKILLIVKKISIS